MRRFPFCATYPTTRSTLRLVRERPEWVKDTIKFEVTQAERITGPDIGRALARQARMHEQSRQFFDRYDYFVLPVARVAASSS